MATNINTVTVTTQDVQKLIADAIMNNQSGVISAMNSSGNSVPVNISSVNLFNAVWNVFTTNGLNGLKSLLNGVQVDKTKDISALISDYKKFNPTPTQTGMVEDINFGNIFTSIGNIILPHSTTIGAVGPTVVNQPLISQGTIIGLSVFSIVAIMLLLVMYNMKS